MPVLHCCISLFILLIHSSPVPNYPLNTCVFLFPYLCPNSHSFFSVACLIVVFFLFLHKVRHQNCSLCLALSAMGSSWLLFWTKPESTNMDPAFPGRIFSWEESFFFYFGKKPHIHDMLFSGTQNVGVQMCLFYCGRNTLVILLQRCCESLGQTAFNIFLLKMFLPAIFTIQWF